MARVLSGIQPSGSLHLGNYLGMMKPMIESQHDNELFCFIVNYHAMTSLHDGAKLRENTLQAAMDFLALGLDPEACYFWAQSDIPEVQELAWALSCHTSLGLLERSHSYKDKVARGLTPNTGLFTYPVLMAADILMFQANIVPVGKDQKQHLEITRDIAIRFNQQFGDVFVLPEPRIDDNLAVVPGLDGQKMSKSYGNAIEIFESEKSMRKKIMRIVTDSTPVEAPKNPDTCNVFALYKLFASEEQAAALRSRYLEGGMGYGEAKTALFELINAYFKPYREKRDALAADPDQVRQVLKRGAEKARVEAMKTIELVREVTGLRY